MPLTTSLVSIAPTTDDHHGDLIFAVTLDVNGHLITAREVRDNVSITAIDGEVTYVALYLGQSEMSALPEDLRNADDFHSLKYALESACSLASDAAETMLRERAQELTQLAIETKRRQEESLRRWQESQTAS